MALKVNATLTFKGYDVDDNGVKLHFVCADPGGGEANDYYLSLTFADLSTVTDLASFNTLVTTRLQRNLRLTGVASKLDALIGRSLVI